MLSMQAMIPKLGQPGHLACVILMYLSTSLLVAQTWARMARLTNHPSGSEAA